MDARLNRPWIRALCLAAALVASYSALARLPAVHAQGPITVAGPGNAPPAVSAVDKQSAPIPAESLITTLKKGGVMMIPILICSFITVVFIFERGISLRRGRVLPKPFIKRFLHQLKEGQLDKAQALELCEQNGSPVAQVFAHAVRKWGRPSVEVEQAVLDGGERAANGLRRNVRIFNGISTLSPLLGLLGTVFGMIRAFNEIARTNAMGTPQLLAEGISEALIATAGGLLIAIPALICYLFFISRVDQLIMEIDALGQEVVNLISAEALAEAPQAKPARRREAAA